MNDLQIFNHPEFGEVRWVEVEGKPGAVGVDIARVLEYANPSKAVIDHCKGITKLGIPSGGGIQETNIILEGDIYRLIVKAADQSKNEGIKAKAEVFERWIFDEVIPTIRKTGTYSVPKSTHPPRTISRVKPAIKDAFDTAEYLTEKLGIKIGIAQAACIRAVEKNSGLDLAEIAKCLPAAEHEPGYLNATQIGGRLGVNAAQANKILLTKGLQEQQVDVKGNKKWRITDVGKQYGEEFPYVRNGHSDYQIRWSEVVMGALEELRGTANE
ncbi:MAG: BRO-N domain-containing protein [Desulfitobacteriaceae bacterium]